MVEERHEEERRGARRHAAGVLHDRSQTYLKVVANTIQAVNAGKTAGKLHFLTGCVIERGEKCETQSARLESCGPIMAVDNER